MVNLPPGGMGARTTRSKRRLDDDYYGDSLMMAISADEPDAMPLDAEAFARSWSRRVEQGGKADDAATARVEDSDRSQKLQDMIQTWVSLYVDEGHMTAAGRAIGIEPAQATSQTRDMSSEGDL